MLQATGTGAITITGNGGASWGANTTRDSMS